MDEASANPTAPPVSTPRPRQLPAWVWFLLVVFFFPAGVFVGLGIARVLTWPRSILLALLSEATTIGFAQLMSSLQENHAREMWQFATLYGGVGMFAAWSYLIYRIGRKASYWSPKVMRSWHRAGWTLGPLFVALGTLTAALMWATHSLRNPNGYVHELVLRFLH